MVFAARRAMH